MQHCTHGPERVLTKSSARKRCSRSASFIGQVTIHRNFSSNIHSNEKKSSADETETLSHSDKELMIFVFVWIESPLVSSAYVRWLGFIRSMNLLIEFDLATKLTIPRPTCCDWLFPPTQMNENEHKFDSYKLGLCCCWMLCWRSSRVVPNAQLIQQLKFCSKICFFVWRVFARVFDSKLWSK